MRRVAQAVMLGRRLFARRPRRREIDTDLKNFLTPRSDEAALSRLFRCKQRLTAIRTGRRAVLTGVAPPD
jgi:predicted neuraminidase